MQHTHTDPRYATQMYEHAQTHSEGGGGARERHQNFNSRPTDQTDVETLASNGYSFVLAVYLSETLAPQMIHDMAFPSFSFYQYSLLPFRVWLPVFSILSKISLYHSLETGFTQPKRTE